jgi:hypothetical protein
MKKLLLLILFFYSLGANSMENIRSLNQQDIISLYEHTVCTNPCPFDVIRLKIVTVKYYDFAGKSHEDGEIMVFDVVAENIAKIFDELHTIKFPIAKVKLINNYNGDDELSMSDNNSSSFNYRNIAGDGKKISLHSYGLAIDINPVQNPVLEINNDGTINFSPKESILYINRMENRPDKATRIGMTEQVISIFTKNGFNIWGGYWDNPIDYHHFQLDRSLAEKLVNSTYEEGRKIFINHLKK